MVPILLTMIETPNDSRLRTEIVPSCAALTGGVIYHESLTVPLSSVRSSPPSRVAATLERVAATLEPIVVTTFCIYCTCSRKLLPRTADFETSEQNILQWMGGSKVRALRFKGMVVNGSNVGSSERLVLQQLLCTEVKHKCFQPSTTLPCRTSCTSLYDRGKFSLSEGNQSFYSAWRA